MTKPVVTIGMPVRNCKQTLRAAVASLTQQSFQEWVLVIIDDGSTDDTSTAFSEFKDHRIKVRKHDGQKGLSARLNEIISSCDTEYFARMDGDDVSYPDRLEKQFEYLRARRHVDLVGTGVLVFGDEGKAIGRRLPPESHHQICSKPHAGFRIAHPSYFGRTSWFRRFGYNERALRCQDQELLLRSFRSSCFANVPEILLGYREPGVKLSKTLRSRLFFAKILLQHYQCEGQIMRGFWGAFGQFLRAQLDVLAALNGLRHTVLTHRSTLVSMQETAAWNKIWRRVTLPLPERSDRTAAAPAHVCLTKTPLVTIGMPFYNPGSLLEEAVRSVLAQTFEDWELILVDDGSTDGSVKFASRIADARVTVRSDGRNLGLAARLNEISDIARGDYILRMDADDMMAPTRLQEQVSFLAANPKVDVVGTEAFVFDSQSKLVGARRIKPREFRSATRCLRQGMVIHPTIMARRDWFRQNRYNPDYIRAEDRELFARVFEKHAVGHLDKLLYFYRVPSVVRLKAFLQGYHSERKVVLRYGPNILGWPRTVALLSSSLARSVLLPILVRAGLQICVVWRLQGKGNLSREEADTGSAILKEISCKHIPMRA